jgi:hypothetical protein
MDPATISSTLNYTVSGSLGIQQVSILTADFTCVQVTFLNPILLDTLYSLNINGVQNCYNSGASNLQSNFIINSPPKRNEIIINEIFADQTPQIGLPNAEFL